MAHQDLCIRCKDPVRARQEGIQCDGCDRWQHRTCNSGISRQQYRNAVRNGQAIDWRCVDCMNMSAGILLPLAESSRVGQGSSLTRTDNAEDSSHGTTSPPQNNEAVHLDNSRTANDELIDEELVNILVDMANETEGSAEDNSTPSNHIQESEDTVSNDSNQEEPSTTAAVEPSLMDPPIANVEVHHAPLTYRIVEEGTKRRKISL
ncbi:PREDICTED: uncharacterized protein LOC107343319, partial [Paramuricea clavata]